MSKPHYRANRDRWQLEMSWNDLASSGCLRTRGCSRIPRSPAGAVPAALPTSPVLVGRAVGMLSPAGPGGWGRVRGGVYQIHLFPAGRCSSSLLPFLAALCCFFLPSCPRHCQVSPPVGDGCDNISRWLCLFLRRSLMGHSWRDSVPGTHNRHNAWDNVLKGMQIPYQCTPPQVLGLFPPFVMAIHFALFFSRLRVFLSCAFLLPKTISWNTLRSYLCQNFIGQAVILDVFLTLFSVGLLKPNLKQHPK